MRSSVSRPYVRCVKHLAVRPTACPIRGLRRIGRRRASDMGDGPDARYHLRGNGCPQSDDFSRGCWWGAHVLLLGCDEPPDLIDLEALASQALEHAVLIPSRRLPSVHNELAYRCLAETSDTRHGADAHPLAKELDCLDAILRGQPVRIRLSQHKFAGCCVLVLSVGRNKQDVEGGAARCYKQKRRGHQPRRNGPLGLCKTSGDREEDGGQITGGGLWDP